jgi:3-oxoacid CoA-transferase subunit A
MWHDSQFSNQYFFENGVHTIYGKTILVLGGAYSVDKHYRLINGYKWFSSEQLTMEEKWNLQQTTYNGKYDYVFSHTCPTNYVPRDMFLPMINQDEVDRSTEDFLQTIHDQITYDKWYCGHWHTDRVVDKMRFVYQDYLEVDNDY